MTVAKNSKRFNITLDGRVYDMVSEMARITGKTKSAILQDAFMTLYKLELPKEEKKE